MGAGTSPQFHRNSIKEGKEIVVTSQQIESSCPVELLTSSGATEQISNQAEKRKRIVRKQNDRKYKIQLGLDDKGKSEKKGDKNIWRSISYQLAKK